MYNEAAQNLSKTIKEKLHINLTKASEQIKKVIISEYDELTNLVVDTDSKANPALYRDAFIERLNSFSFVESDGKNVVMHVPDMETFDFSGKLKIIETILNGVAGVYVEMSLEDFMSIFKRTPFTPDSPGAQDLAKEQIYLIRYNENIKNIEKHLRKKFVVYPFSNVPPIDVLEKAGTFTDNNMKKWVDTAVEEAKNEFVGKHKGVIS